MPGGEEHPVRHVDESARRPRFDIREHVVVAQRADSGGGDACDAFELEPTGGSLGAVLDREVLLCSGEEMEFGFFLMDLVLLSACAVAVAAASCESAG